VLVGWGLLVAVLLVAKPDKQNFAQAARVLPDVVRLVGRLARDRALSRGVRWAPWLLLGSSCCPLT
jgi:hypothetical protein